MYFTVYQDKAGKWRWTAKAVNPVIIGDSGQGYADKDNCGDYISKCRRWIIRPVSIATRR